MAGLLNDVSMMGLKGSRNVDTTKRTVYNNNPMAVSLRNSSGNVIPYNGLLGVQGEYEKSLTDTMGQYIDPAHGLRAGIRNLRIQAKNLGDEKSLYDLIARWHGKNQGEQKTADYASMIAKSMGDSRNPKDIKIGDIDFNDSAVKSKIINPIISWEGGGASLPQHIIDMAIDMEQPKQEQRPQMQPQVGLPPQFAMEGFGTPPPLKLGEPTGEYTPEGRPLLLNNQGGKSSEYSVGVTDPRINNKALTHIPSIYDGSILNQKDAIQEVVDAGGYDRLTGRYIEPGGDPNARSMSLGNIPHHIGGATTDTSRYRQQRLPTLQEVAETAQVQPALDPFPWLRETHDRRSKVGMYPEKKKFKSRSMYPQPKNF